MKRVLALLPVAAALALAAALPVGADTVGEVSPACVDITEGHAAFNVPAQGGATATGSLVTAAASCPNVTYTMWVSYSAGNGATTLRVDTLAGDGSALYEDGTDFVGNFSVRVPKSVTSVCIGFTTSEGSTILDKAPDAFSPPSTGCVALAQNESGGGFFW
jgi:hypothetical protein